MPREILYKLVFILGIGGLFLFLSYPPEDQIKLGLDLRGGIHLKLRVVVEEAVAAETRDARENFQELLDDDGIEVAATDTEPQRFTVTLADAGDIGQAEDIAAEWLTPSFDISRASADPPTLSLALTTVHRNDVEDRAVRQALQTIRNRIDQFGVAEPVIQRLALTGDRILVQLPGVEDPERVKNILRTSALLEWKLVEGGPAPTRVDLLPPNGVLADGMAIYQEDVAAEGQAPHSVHYYMVQDEPIVTGRELKAARLGQDDMGLPAVHFSLGADGARRFSDFTAANIGRQLAIILDNKVQSAPVIRSQIPNGQGIIEGTFTAQEAEDLALVLRAGALPASIQYLEERSVGPSLGRESIERGVSAALVGLALVVAFMLVYYKGSGINAVVALALNLVIVLGVMASLEATLTLPGIAGLILLIGMAVDANVLIFERIREELDLGKTVRSSIDAGFSKAFSAILDANITTLIAAVFLFQFGTGPVKGFAVTITIGIVASMFTALFVSRVLFSLWVARRPGSLSI